MKNQSEALQTQSGQNGLSSSFIKKNEMRHCHPKKAKQNKFIMKN